MLDDSFVIIGWSGEVCPMHQSSDQTGEHYSHADLEDEAFNDQVILMQSTELKDKNGKLIFEGDIIESDDKSYQAKVEWVGSRAGFMRVPVKAWMGSGVLEEADAERYMEIIGNIHEHPELLGESK